MDDRHLILTDAALQQYGQQMEQQGLDKGLWLFAKVAEPYSVAVAHLLVAAAAIEGAALSNGGAATVETIKLYKAKMIERLDLLRSTIKQLERDYPVVINADVLAPQLAYIQQLYTHATRYVEAAPSLAQQRQRELRAFIEAQDRTGSIEQLLNAIESKPSSQPGIAAILRYHAAHYRKDKQHRTYRAMERQFKLSIARKQGSATTAELEAVNILTYHNLKPGEQWGRIVRRYQGAKLTE